MNTVATTYVEQTRAARTDALMWVAQHAHLLADGYSIGASSGRNRSLTGEDRYLADDIGRVQVQGEAGSLRSLIARFDAVPFLDRSDDNFAEWIAYDEGVEIAFVEERRGR